MTQPAVFTKISGYYDKLVAQHGHDPKACDYGHPLSQQAKFTVLESAIPEKVETLLDVGCGFADFAGFLAKRRPELRYTGIDIAESMVHNARKLYPQLAIQHGNILETDVGMYDFVTANGIFYLLGSEANNIMQTMLAKMFDHARYGVAFTSLSRWAGDQEPGEFYADPLETLAFCRTITPWVSLRHDYHGRDFLITMHKERQC